MADNERADDTDVPEHAYYWCLRHSRVETAENLCPSRFRIGPFPDAASAERGLETMHERTRQQDAEDADWDRH